MNLFKYIYYKAHQLNLKNNNFGEGKFGSLFAGTFILTASVYFISLGLIDYLSVIFKINLLKRYGSVDKFSSLAFLIIFVVCPVWLYLKKKNEKIIQEYDIRSSKSKFYRLSPYLVISIWCVIITVWLLGSLYLMWFFDL
jgi:hypothetical protein